MAVKLAGGAYLVYRWLKMLFKKQALSAEKREALDLRPHKTIFLQALITNVMHPKVILFFMSFFPQFVNHDSPHTGFFIAGCSVCYHVAVLEK